MATYDRTGRYAEVTKFPAMIGAVLSEVIGKIGDEELVFKAADGSKFTFWYEPDCCATCSITDIIGDIADLIGSPIVDAEEVSSEGAPAPENADSYTWTFYRFSTVKGTVTIRWLGESNGYYSESVSFRAGEAP